MQTIFSSNVALNLDPGKCLQFYTHWFPSMLWKILKVCKQGVTLELFILDREAACLYGSDPDLLPCNCSLYWLCQNKPVLSYSYTDTTSTYKVREWWVHSDWSTQFFKNWFPAWAMLSREGALADSSRPTAGAQLGAGFPSHLHRLPPPATIQEA